MDHSQLSSLKRYKLQHLAKREGLKANLKNVEIIRLLLEKYPGGVPELAENPPASKRSSSSKAKRPARSSRKSTTKSGAVSVKTEESHPNTHVEPPLDEREVLYRGRDVRSMAPPPITPTAALYHLRTPVNWQLPTTPPIDMVTEDGHVVDDRDAVHPPEATPTPPEAVEATSHQVREMLRSLRDVIDATSLEPEKPSSILHRARALSTVLDTAILPRMMKVDKEVKDLVWHRAVIEETLGPQFKQSGVLPGVSDVRPKRPREEGGGEADPPPLVPRPFKRTRVQ